MKGVGNLQLIHKLRIIIKFILLINIFGFSIITNSLFAEINQSKKNINDQLNIYYLQPRGILNDYILGTGDTLFIEFFPQTSFSSFYTIDEEGEIFLPILKETYVKGLTPSELNNLLEESYSELTTIDELKVKVITFRSLKLTVKGEVINPGDYIFPAYTSMALNNVKRFTSMPMSDEDVKIESIISNERAKNYGEKNKDIYNVLPDRMDDLTFDDGKKETEGKLIMLSDLILSSGGLTSFSDTSKIKIIRKASLSEGGGNKQAIFDFKPFLEDPISSNDIRLYSGDQIVIPKLSQADKSLISKSVLRNLTPRFINIFVSGKIETPGVIKIPVNGTLSDLIDISGPRKPLSGKIVLIRYNRDGSYEKRNISYKRNAKVGSQANPVLKEGDLVSVTQSFYGKTTDFIREVTAPAIGIFATKEVIDDFFD